MVRSLYRFHVHYYVRRVLERLQVPLPHEAGFNAADNSFPHDPIRYRMKSSVWTCQRGVKQLAKQAYRYVNKNFILHILAKFHDDDVIHTKIMAIFVNWYFWNFQCFL